jgi:hypothetical protein
MVDGRLLRALGVTLDEATRGKGDGLTADASCHLPPSFHAEHLSFPLNHGQELWDRDLQDEIIRWLGTF